MILADEVMGRLFGVSDWHEGILPYLARFLNQTIHVSKLSKQDTFMFGIEVIRHPANCIARRRYYGKITKIAYVSFYTVVFYAEKWGIVQ